MICNCGATAISSIPLLSCVDKIGQVQKAVLQLTYDASGNRNEFTIATANPNIIASWTPLLAAVDQTKVVQTPFIANNEWGEGESVTFGGGEETIDGIEHVVATDPTTFTGRIYNPDASTIEALQNYGCLNLQIYMINQYGKIIGENDDNTTPTVFRGLVVAEDTFWVGDLVGGGRTGRDYVTIRWQFQTTWSNNLHFITPTDFDAKTALVTP